MGAMSRVGRIACLTALLCSTAGLCLTARALPWKHGPLEAPLDPTKGVKLASRIPCDGATNPEDQVVLNTTFSGDGVPREFRISVFEDKFCKRGDLGWACVQPGHDAWKTEWLAASTIPHAVERYGLSSCEAWGYKAQPQIVLTGWYKQPAPDEKNAKKDAKKEVWKQVEVKKVDSRWEIYEFTDPDGGTARVEIGRR